MTSVIFDPRPPGTPSRRLPAKPRRSGPRPLPPPVAIPGVLLRRVVGTGGVGVVYEGWDERLARTVAVKLLHSGGWADPQADERFRYEAQLVARLRHPGIVQPYQLGEAEGVTYLMMEFVDGPDLYTAAAGKRADPVLAAAVVRAAAEAVGYAHHEGVIHRDLKPGNILLAGPDLAAPVRVTDFGMARLMDGHPELTQDGTVAGTPGYMAPEQCVLNGPVGPWTDVYALGVILYELLTGRPPVDPEPALLYLSAVQRQVPPPPRQLVPGVPADLESICLKCLAKDPRDRYLTATDLAADLQRFADGQPVAACRLGAVQRLTWAARRHPLVAGLLLLLVLVLAAGTLAALRFADRAQQAAADARRARDDESAARRQAEVAADAAVEAHRREAIARVAAQRAVADSRAAAQTAAEQERHRRNAEAEYRLVHDLFLTNLFESAREANTVPALADTVAGLLRRIERQYADNPYLMRRVRLLAGQRCLTLGLPDEAERYLRETFDQMNAAGDDNRFIAGFELGNILLNSGRADQTVELSGRLSAECLAANPTDQTGMNLRIQTCRALLAVGRRSSAAELAARVFGDLSAGDPGRRVWGRLLAEATRDPGGAVAGPAAAYP